MTPLLFLGLSVAGGVGAALRLWVDGAIRTRFGERMPWGTLVINVSGALLLGLLTGLAVGAGVPNTLKVVLGTGFLGGYTTFSTAMVETVRLAMARRIGAALGNGLGMLVLSVAAATLGYVFGTGP